MILPPPPIQASQETKSWRDWFLKLQIIVSSLGTLKSKATDPTTTDIPVSQWAIYKNTSTLAVKLWVNDGGTLKSVTLT